MKRRYLREEIVRQFRHLRSYQWHSLANRVLDRIEPIVEKHGAGRDSSRPRGILHHGVVSFPALQRRNQLG